MRQRLALVVMLVLLAACHSDQHVSLVTDTSPLAVPTPQSGHGIRGYVIGRPDCSEQCPYPDSIRAIVSAVEVNGRRLASARSTTDKGFALDVPPGEYRVTTVAPFATCPATQIAVPSHGAVTIEVSCDGEGDYSP